jgi:LuxR family maltose regulon positive regulatory protein
VIRRLSDDPVPTLTLLNAPAGYGKTTTMRQWWEEQARGGTVAAWLSLDRNDQDPATFMSYLIASFDAAGLRMDDLMTAAEARLMGTPIPTVLPLLINRIAEFEAPLYLFLDDYQDASCAEVDALLGEILTYTQGKLHTVIAARRRPELDVADLRLKQDVREFGVNELRFDKDESFAFIGYQDEMTMALVENSEGWPAALQLARLWLGRQEVSTSKDTARSFTGRSSDLASYLAEQVFSRLPSKLQDRLLRISILDRFNGDLINALCDCTDGWQTVEEIEEQNLFITALGDEQDWYAMHQLFRSFLFERLRRQHASDVDGLNRTAALWFRNNGYMGDALQQARKSNDLELLEQIMQDAGGWTIALQAGIQSLHVIMSVASRDSLEHPAIALGQVYVLLQSGKISEARGLYDRINGAGISGSGFDEPSLTISAGLLDNVIRLYEDRPLMGADLDHIQDLLEAQEAPNETDHNVLKSLRCYESYQKSRFEDCIARAQAVLEGFLGDRAFYGAFFIHCYTAMSEFALGNIADAKATLEEGIRVASSQYGVFSNQVAIARVLLSELAYEQNELRLSRDLLAQSFDDIRRSGGWFDVLTTGFCTRTSLMILDGETEEAFEFMDRGDFYANKLNLPRLSEDLLVHRVRLLMRLGKTEQACELASTDRFEKVMATTERDDVRAAQVRDPARCVRADLLSQKGASQDAPAIIAAVIDEADHIGHRRRAIRARITAAVIAARAGQAAKARDFMVQALDLASGRGFIRSFLDAGRAAFNVLQDIAAGSDQYPEKTLKAAEYLLSLQWPLLSGDENPQGRSATLIELSPREQEVLAMLARGFSSKEMARELELAEGTIKVHRKRLYKKLGAHNRSTALALAGKQGFIS